MAHVGLKEASRLTGKNQSTIHRAMKSGRLSFTLSNTGERLIDPAELDRVFPIHISQPDEDARQDAPEPESNLVQLAKLSVQLEAERGKTALLQDRLADKDGVIDDLRKRLDTESEERRRTQAQLTALLTDQREKRHEGAGNAGPLPSLKTAARRRWWLFGGRG